MSRKKTFVSVIILVFLAFVLILVTRVRFRFHDSIEGFFVLEGENGCWLELTDDLYPENASRLLLGKATTFFKSVVRSSCVDSAAVCLDFEWDEKKGHGYIKSIYPGGRKLLFNLGRYIDDNGRVPAGIFIGGGLPPSDPDYLHLNRDATGTAYFDGKRWYHIWCNVNEGLSSVQHPYLMLYPSDWTFRGSRVLENDGRHLSMVSRHGFTLENVPCRLERYLFYTVGDPYVTLVTEITNTGKTPVSLRYTYGDEPWLGNFGSSAGNVGWLGDGLVLTERQIDTNRYTFAGMFDYGNELAGEEHDHTFKANFLQWDSDSAPSRAYFSNILGGVTSAGHPIPLNSPSSRFLGLIWGPVTIEPRQSFSFTLAVGMAGNDPATGFPVKPPTVLDRR